MGATCCCQGETTNDATLLHNTWGADPLFLSEAQPSNTSKENDQGNLKPTLLGRVRFSPQVAQPDKGGALPLEQVEQDQLPSESNFEHHDSVVRVSADGTKNEANWTWPAWVLNRSVRIEVHVVDEESGDSRWVEAVPRSRIVDADGHDAWLSARYNWDGELYDQDFHPGQVRKLGSTLSVEGELRHCSKHRQIAA
uniref:Uncharacterized protein n=1 Tax=Pyrodinium bahamense TaxID=73915 RepID=A0A7S0FXE1_9DINO|mmetsp:Transcript_53477/g.148222  ORF Transcript_53477/g.148222 Transcript_53477/m.148222 type:complete len:196 (+) Transcript_53477:78-665(+)|eukprot:CAMPEP_0179091412 /NCGR_PEP_ID=MMETSP0796-20121207/41757_1 /TAXON_ID=73915 /ORGANISM="Pyrodinium bahamense, Strain pbaha01" /LENGTH=195 /DNA_ID=CAMNT_0020789003 /DNA_START=78 /DNA_END=665 /DNA_ORIENTATION=+